jgi:hypothetical protein
LFFQLFISFKLTTALYVLMRATCASLFLASSFCSIEETMRHEARRAPVFFFLELEQKVDGKRVSFSFSVLSFGLFQKRTLKERTDDVLERDRQQVALLDGELLVVDKLRDLFLIEGEREEKREVSFFFSFVFFVLAVASFR